MEAERTGVKFDPSGECLGPPQVGNDVRALEKNDRKDSPEQGTDADVFFEIPECWNCSVFGTQLPVFFAAFFFYSGLQRFHLYLENTLPQHPRACFIPLRDQTTSFSHLIK